MAVVVRERPELNGKPVAVCHSDSARGTGEISSANYPARAFGQSHGISINSSAYILDLALADISAL